VLFRKLDLVRDRPDPHKGNRGLATSLIRL
jgi:hypothetical protein